MRAACARAHTRDSQYLHMKREIFRHQQFLPTSSISFVLVVKIECLTDQEKVADVEALVNGWSNWDS
ncbi:unnamed protein product [Litomosoides sigmodontis]|uniref:Uncharacterized protein n=1 Tax=Litomosoides sigmodontis TaxID=42156 RepID=A0A3P7K4F0_LITSI|nr:unnamed protein product [Litomosoides sigmodontis]